MAATANQTGSFSFQVVDQTTPTATTPTVSQATSTVLPTPVVGERTVGPVDFAHLTTITGLAAVNFRGTTFNRDTQTLHVDVSLTNTSLVGLGEQIVLAIDRFTPPAVQLDNPDLLHPDDDRPLIVFGPEFGADGLLPGETSQIVALSLSNPSEARFGVVTTLLAPGNEVPVFTSTPVTQVDPETPYTYQATATDDNGDTLTFALLVGPDGMTVGAQPGTLAWTPTAAQLGTWSVVLQVSDGRGGTGTQSYTLQVGSGGGTGPTNHAPIFVSTLVSPAMLAGQTFSYTAQALDPDGDDVTYSLTTAPAGATVDPDSGFVTWSTAPVSQYASEVLGFSSQNPFSGFQAVHALGAPDQLNYGSIPGAWAPASTNGTQEFLTLGFATPVHATGVTIREVFGNGFVTQVDLLDTDGIYHTVFTGPDYTVAGAVASLDLQFAPTAYLVRGVKTYVNTNHSGSWEEIESVQLHSASLGFLKQWGNRVIDVTSEYSSGAHAAAQALGSPNVPAPNGRPEAWAPANQNGTLESIAVGFATPVHATGVLIREAVNNGFVTRVDLLDTDGVYHTVSSGADPTSGQSPQDFLVHFDRTAYLVQGVRVFVDTNHTSGYEEIDAIALLSDQTVPFTVHADDGLGGVAAQSFDVTIQSTSSGVIRGTKFFDHDADGISVNDVDHAGNLIVNGDFSDGYTGFFTQYQNIPIFQGWYSLERVVGNAVEHTTGTGLMMALNGHPGRIVWQQTVPVQPHTNYVLSTWATTWSPGSPALLRFQVNGSQVGAPFQLQDSPEWQNFTAVWNSGASTTATIDMVDLNGDFFGNDFAIDDISFVQGDQSEPVLPNWTIYLDQNANGRRDPGERFTTTDASGNYVFTDLAPGTYIVAEEPQFGWVQTSPSSRTHTITVSSGQVINDVDFGNRLAGESGPNDNPVFTSTPPASAAVGEVLRYQAAASDTDGDALHFEVVDGPTGLAVDLTSGVMVWVPAENQGGSHQVTLRVLDGRGGEAFQNFSVSVSGGTVVAGGLAITSTPIVLGGAGQAYAYTVTAEDDQGETPSYALQVGPDGMTIDSQSGVIAWTPAIGDVGPHVVLIQATTPGGGTAFQSYVLTVRTPNQAPVIVSAPPTSVAAQITYLYAVQAFDTSDAISFALTAAPAGMTIDSRSGFISWQPGLADVGAHPIVVRVTDERGAFTDQSYTLSVFTDTEAPAVTTIQTINVVNVGEDVGFAVLASDNVGVVATSLTINGTPYEIIDNGFVNFVPTAPGIYTIVGTATDAAGNVGSHTVTLRVLDPDDVTEPTVIITSPTWGDSVTYLTPISGTVTDPNLEFYRVEYSRLGSEEWHLIEEHTTAVEDDTLATFDPTLLPNDAYWIRVTAQDVSGNIYSLQTQINVSQNAKIGNFHLEYTDLSIPLAGIPIQVTRVYDTLQADQMGDFGFGWTMGLANANIRETVPQDPNGFFATGAAFRAGTKVYLTTPDGNRVGFTFDPIRQDFDTVTGLPFPFGPVWKPHFKADPGVFETLEVADISLTQRGDGTFGFYLFGIGFNPDDFTLTTKDGTRYQYNQSAGLQTVTDTNSNTLTFTADGIFSSTGQSIDFVRDAVGRITEIVDPAGNSILYNYDASGNLVSVTNQAGLTSTYEYLSDPAHYLSAAFDPEGIRALGAAYDEDGRYIATTDALGNTAHISYDLGAFSETITDPMGNEGTLVFDDRGNIIVMTDGRGATTHITYDANNLPIAVQDAGGFTTHMEYDARGNLTKVTDALTNTVEYTYNSFNKLVTTTDALGNSSTAEYDANGNLTAYVDAAGARTEMTRDQYGRQTSFTNAYDEITTFVFASVTDNKPTLVIHPDGTTRQLEYNHFGQVVRVVDENGNEIEFTYDPSGRMLTMTDQDGFTTTLTYEGSRVVALEDPLGRVTQFEHDAAGRIIREIDPAGGIKESTYDANNRLISETDAEGRTATYTYDANGNLTSVHINPTWTFEYDLRGNVSKATDGNGNVVEYVYDELNRLIRATSIQDCGCNPFQTYEYDAVGNMIRATDGRGNPTTFTYDEMGRTLTQTDALGNTVAWTYNFLGDTTSFTDPNGHTTDFNYDTGRSTIAANEETYMFAYASRLTSVVDPLGAETEYEYDAVGNVTGITDALDRTTTFGYDRRGNLVSVIDPLGGSFSYTYDDNGNLTSYTDALDRVTSFTYDVLDQLSTVTDALGAVTHYVFNGVGNLVSFTDAAGETSLFVYDALDRLIEATDPLGGVTHYVFDGNDNLLSVTDPTGATITNEYDELNLLVKTTDAVGQSWIYDYDKAGNQVLQVDPLGRQMTYAFDAVNRLITTTDSGGGTVHYGYDDAGNLTSLTDQNNNTTLYGYDAADQLVSETDSLNHSRLYTYDLVGNLTGIIDRNGRTREFTYDDLDRVSQEQWLVGSTAVRTMGYTYDAVDNLLTATDPDASYAFTYDDRDRLTSVDNLGTPLLPHVVLNYGYDDVDNLTSITDNAGVQVLSTYNANGWLTSRAWSGPGIDPVHADFTYNARGGIDTIKRYSDGVGGPQLVSQSQFTFDAAGQMTDLVHKNSAGTPLVSYHYVHNIAGELISETHHGQTSDYGYDTRGQLTTADHSGQTDEGYTFDAAGNRVGGGFVIGPGNRVLSDPQFDYVYDNEGNQIQKTDRTTGNVTTYTFDFRNRLTAVEERTSGGALVHSAEFTYDLFDRRIAQNVDGVFTAFVHSGDRPWADYNAGGQVIARYLYGAEGTDDLLARQRTGEGTVWYLGDHQFTVRDLVDANGVIIDTIHYDSFGNIVLETAPGFGDRFKFTGREYEAATGLYYYRSRWYDPKQGRFIGEDSWGLAAGDPNFYRYVFNSPVNYTDPSGHTTAVAYAFQIASFLIPALGVDASCLSDRGLEISVTVAVPFTDMRYTYKHTAEGFGIPIPSSDELYVSITSCAKLYVSAWANGIFAQLGAELTYFELTSAGHAVDCVEFGAQKALGSISDYSFNVKVACDPDGPNKVSFTSELALPSVPPIPVGAWTGAKSSDHDNCFLAGHRTLLAGPHTAGDFTWYDQNRFWLGAVAIGVGLLAALKEGRRRKPEEEEAEESFWTQYGRDEEREDEGEEFVPTWTPSVGSWDRDDDGGVALAEPMPAVARVTLPNRATAPASVVRKNSPEPVKPNSLLRRCMMPGLCALLACFFLLDPFGLAGAPSGQQTKAIEEVEAGDIVQAWDEATDQMMPRRVVQTFRNVTYEVRHLTVRGADGREQTLLTTDGHPFWVVGEGWVDAGDLEVGDSLRQADGSLAPVVGSELEERPEGVATFNFEVEGSHTYYVVRGDEKSHVLVHNASLRRPYLRAGLKDAVRKAAKRRADATGRMRCVDPGTKKFIKGKPHFGHKYGHEHWRLVEHAEKRKWTQKQFNDYVNKHPEFFQLEDARSNVSHAFEKP